MKHDESKSLQSYLQYAGDAAKLDSGIEIADRKFRGSLLIAVAFFVIRGLNLLYDESSYSDESGLSAIDVGVFILLLIMTLVFWIRLHLLWVLKAALGDRDKKTAVGTNPAAVGES